MIKHVVYIVLLAASWALLAKCSSDNKELKEQLEVSTDIIKRERDKDGKETVTAAIYYAERNTLRDALKEKDKELVKLVKQKTISATIVKIEAKVRDSGNTIITMDTAIVNDTILLTPVYAYEKSDEHMDIDVLAMQDSTFVNVKIRDKLTITQEFKRDALLGQKKPYITITHSNPMLTTNEVRSFAISVKKPKRLLWFIGGVVVGGIVAKNVAPR